MRGDAVLYEKKGKIGLLTLNRPKRYNILNRDMISHMRYYLTKLKDDHEIKVIIITGAGEFHFCEGADFNQVVVMSPRELEEYMEEIREILHLIDNQPQVIIGAINGNSRGLGVELMLVMDLLVGSTNASFSMTETHYGLIPTMGGTQRLPRMIGIQRAKEIIFSGRMVSAQEARQLGIYLTVNQDYMLEAQMLAESMVENSADALCKAKLAINKGIEMPLNEALRFERELFRQSFYSMEVEKNIKQYLKKRSSI